MYFGIYQYNSLTIGVATPTALHFNIVLFFCFKSKIWTLKIHFENLNITQNRPYIVQSQCLIRKAYFICYIYFCTHEQNDIIRSWIFWKKMIHGIPKANIFRKCWQLATTKRIFQWIPDKLGCYINMYQWQCSIKIFCF